MADSKTIKIKYYICKLPEIGSCCIFDKKISIDNFAFKNATIENIIFRESILLEEATFEGCKKLKFIAWGHLDSYWSKEIFCLADANKKNKLKALSHENSVVNSFEDIKIESFKTGRKVVIPKNTFKNCEKLETIVFPTSKCIIDKDSFAHCKALRTVVFLGDDISLIGNPFIGCSDLTIVCKKGNGVLKAFREAYSFKVIEID